MRRIVTCAIVLGASLLLSLLSASPSAAAVYYGFTIGVTNAPPPPVVRKLREPHCVRANDAMVYVVDDERADLDADAFRYGQYWFIYARGYWYRGMEFRGPYSVIDVRRVPRAILGVPRSHWKHHPLGGAPGQMKKAQIVDTHARGNSREAGNAHGAGTSRGASHSRGAGASMAANHSRAAGRSH
jgi:hypothetical protein